MKVISFFNNKGGVGKTTLLCNVAAYLSLRMNYRVAVVDADPQCNSTQYLFSDGCIDEIYDNQLGTIYQLIHPLTMGESVVDDIKTHRSENFGVDVIPGDPDLALLEDFLAQDWSSAIGGSVRGMKTSMIFANIIDKLSSYDFVLVDVSPSLGAINRSVLMASDYYMSPMSLDIFSLRAFKNISKWVGDWERRWRRAIEELNEDQRGLFEEYKSAQFIGYVTQQYYAKKDADGTRRGVKAYEEIRTKIDDMIVSCGLHEGIESVPFEIGSVPNLFSLIPMSQSRNKPVFDLQSKDGVVGAHFAKVRDAEEILSVVSANLISRLK